MSLIQLKHASKSFGSQHVLRDITLDVREGETLVLIGESGCGKSVTMKRFHTRGRGKSTRILKPFSRLRIVVREVEEA